MAPSDFGGGVWRYSCDQSIARPPNMKSNAGSFQYKLRPDSLLSGACKFGQSPLFIHFYTSACPLLVEIG